MFRFFYEDTSLWRKLIWITVLIAIIAIPVSIYFYIQHTQNQLIDKNITTPESTISLYSTIKNIGVIASFRGDTNGNNTATMEYRQAGEQNWHPGIPMTADRRSIVIEDDIPVPNPYVNQWRASVLMLKPDTDYQVRVTFLDSDGVSGVNQITSDIRTRKDIIPAGNGKIYYVAKNGSDDHDGSEASPWLTIQKAADSVMAGDTVYIKTGIYKEAVTITASGTADNYILFSRFGNDEVIIDGEGVRDFNISIGVSGIADWNWREKNGGDYVRIYGLKCQNAKYAGINIAGDNVYFENNVVENFNSANQADGDPWCAGITVNNWGTRNMVLRYNVITRNIPGGNNDYGGPSGIQIRNEDRSTGGGHVIAGNRIFTAQAQIRDDIGGLPNFSIPGCLYHDSDVYDNYFDGAYDDNIESEGGNINIRIWGNIAKNTLSNGIALCSNIIGPVYIFRNQVINFGQSPEICGAAFKVGVNSTGMTYIYHNTLYSSYSSASGLGRYGSEGIDNLIVKNNIFYTGRYTIEIEADTSSGTGNQFDYNCWYTTNNEKLFKWYGIRYYQFPMFQEMTSQESHGLDLDCQFINQNEEDLRLQPESPCIDRGVILPGFNDQNSPWPFHGSAPDIGALESSLSNNVSILLSDKEYR